MPRSPQGSTEGPRVLKTAPDSVARGRGVRKPSEDSIQFLMWFEDDLTQKEGGNFAKTSGTNASSRK
eukprot:8616311-Pyramimonas_sp.AAC.1